MIIFCYIFRVNQVNSVNIVNSVNSKNSVNSGISVNSVNSVNGVNSVNSYSAVLPPSPMVFFVIIKVFGRQDKITPFHRNESVSSPKEGFLMNGSDNLSQFIFFSRVKFQFFH